MRALLKDMEDQTLIAVEVTEAVYDADIETMYLRNADTEYQIEHIARCNVDAIMRRLVEDGTADLTNYPAFAEDD